MVPTSPVALSQWARDHTVGFEVWPAQVPLAGELRTIGYDLSLFATHEPSPLTPVPGCDRCFDVWKHLAQIAHAVLPAEEHSSLRIRPYHPSLDYSGHQPMSASVELVIEIRHQTSYETPLDACETSCLAKITGGLEALGIHRRHRHSR